jgi:hypothetical protein
MKISSIIDDMVWIAEWPLGGTDFLPGDSGEIQKTVNLTVCQLMGKFDGEPNLRADTWVRPYRR